ncbi:MAG: hypothetical protein B6I20_08535 [Bacteroidetes bacterium 4572_117]|nr:MAG: hypothetical protein B6I20_08535 [Bacteroidetes bacterium 4572_117]
MDEYFHNKVELQIVTADSTRNIINIYQPFFVRNVPVIVIMPALGVKAEYYGPFAMALKNKGYIAISVDLRGNGKSSVKSVKKRNFGYHEMLSFDWPAILEKVNKHFPENKIYLLGHSLGGQLNVLYASQYSQLISGLILVASCSVHYKGWSFPHNLGVLAATQLARLLVKVLGYFPGKKIGFAGTEAKNVILDWAYNARTGRYKVLKSVIDFERDIQKIKLPVFAISFQADKLAPQKAVQGLISKMNIATVNHKHYNGTDLDHFNWVKDNNFVVSEIVKWLNKNL